jgi:hypothetical protein
VTLLSLALDANSNELLILPVKVDENLLVEHSSHVDNPELIYHFVERFLFDDLEFDVHVAKLTYFLHFLRPEFSHKGF